MSTRYSRSPSLHLEIVRSRIHCLLHGLLCLLVAAGLYRIAQRGYPVPALLLSPLAALCWWRTARQPLAGTQLSWRRGQWCIGRGEQVRAVTPGRGSTCLPWVIYFAWVEPGERARRSALLFPDSAPRRELRRLRVRLALQR